MARVQNTVNLIGRMVKDPEVRAVGSTTVANFSIAVERIRGKNGEAKTDFINCQAWSHTAEFVQKFLGKGRKIVVQGELQVDSFQTKDGAPRSSTYVRVDSIDFADGKPTEKSGSDSAAAKPKAYTKPAVNDDDLPDFLKD